MKRAHPMVLGFVGEKGGLGKTTLTICVAGELASRGNKVLVLDCDVPQCASSRWATLAQPKGSLHFDVAQVSGAENFKQLDFDYVLLDLPGHRSPVFKSVATQADHLIMPVAASLEVWSVEPTNYVAQNAGTQQRANGRRSLSLSVVLNKVRPGIQSSIETYAAIRKNLKAKGIHVLNTEVRDLTAFRERILQGELPSKSRDRAATLDINALVSEIQKLLSRSAA